MDIYDYAMKLEKDGEEYYRELAGRVVHGGLKTILTMLADAEARHYAIFRKMKDNEAVEVFTDAALLSNVKNIFEKMRESDDVIAADGSEIDVYKRAQDIEKKTQDFYLEKAGEVTAQGQKDTFLRIADEEKRHYFIIENIINFVARPFNWLENAEWYHLEEY